MIHDIVFQNVQLIHMQIHILLDVFQNALIQVQNNLPIIVPIFVFKPAQVYQTFMLIVPQINV